MNEHVTKILNGEGIAREIRAELKHKISHFRIQPSLAIVLIGHDPASHIYVDFKKKASIEVGIQIKTIEFDMTVKEREVLDAIESLNIDPTIHGILVQLPFPDHLSVARLIRSIDPRKDVDGLTPLNFGNLATGFGEYFIPATAKGIMALLKQTHVDLVGQTVVIIGRSLIVGHPLVELFMRSGATVTICHRRTKNLSSFTKKADIVISGVGQADLITEDMVQDGVIVIDAGIVKKDHRIVGDVDFNRVSQKASFITPIPGGVGPMTVAALLENTWIAMRRIEGYEE